MLQITCSKTRPTHAAETLCAVSCSVRVISGLLYDVIQFTTNITSGETFVCCPLTCAFLPAHHIITISAAFVLCTYRVLSCLLLRIQALVGFFCLLRSTATLCVCVCVCVCTFSLSSLTTAVLCRVYLSIFVAQPPIIPSLLCVTYIGLARTVYTYTAYDRMFGDFPAKITVYTSYIYMALAHPTQTIYIHIYTYSIWFWPHPIYTGTQTQIGTCTVSNIPTHTHAHADTHSHLTTSIRIITHMQ